MIAPRTPTHAEDLWPQLLEGCSLACDLCGSHTTTAVHTCGLDCRNLCIACVDRITAAVSTKPQTPTAAALDDYAEYRRYGGHFDLRTWWDRYKDNYKGDTQ
jgi:hypothetical protein